MRDVVGFAILVGALVLGLWMLVQGVLPLVSAWLAGMAGFFLVAAVLLRGGRRCPDRLPFLLRPGVAPVLVLAALGLPALHGALLFLVDNPHWHWVLAANALPTTAFASRAVARHLLESRRFVREGHDVAGALGDATARQAALGVLSDRLAMVAGAPAEPEAWERVAGDALGITEIPLGDVEALQRRVQELQAPLAEVAARLGTLLEEVRGGRAPALPHPDLEPVLARLAPLEAEADALAEAVEQCLGESPGASPSTWMP